MWSILFGFQISLDTYYVNPISKSDKSKAIITEYNGKIRLVDFSEYSKPIDIIDFIQIQYSVGFSNALSIAKHLYEKHAKIYSKVKVTRTKKVKYRTRIQCTTRDFNEHDIRYWKQYGINTTQLLLNDVYAISDYKINDNPIVECRYRTYAILFPDQSIKIYSPVRKEGKWISNASGELICGRYSTNHDHLIVTKSYKDYQVLTNLGYNTCYVQSEVSYKPFYTLAITMEDVARVYLAYDRDETGIANSLVNTHYFNQLVGYKKASSIILPRGIFDDPASFYKHDAVWMRKFFRELCI